MSESHSVRYDCERKYAQEFKDNLNDCKREYNALFNNNNAAEQLCCVAAPGICIVTLLLKITYIKIVL